MADDADSSVARELRELLTDRGETLAVAESSTGGLVGSMITDVPGASAYFDRAVVTYSNEAKVDLLDVDPTTLERVGAVSAAIAREMATGIRENAASTWGLSTTGIAGPGGGTEEKPVGTIYVGVAHADAADVQTSASRYHFDGSRRECKLNFAERALSDLLAAVDSPE